MLNDRRNLLRSVAMAVAGYAVSVVGPPLEPDTDNLRADLETAGLATFGVSLQLIPEQRIVLNATN